LSIHYWSALHSDLRHHLSSIRADWQALLGDDSNTEPVYQRFLQEHAGFFWADGINCVVVLSQVRLGRDFVVDFVRASERGSQGFHYELIEIESPHEAPYNAQGRPGKRLASALEQITDWRHWLAANTAEAKRVFPSKDFVFYDEPSFSYTVVTGRRVENDEQRRRRNRRAKELGVTIRSFDALTDWVTKRPYLDVFDSCAPECSRLPVEIRNALANPFNVSIGDSAWSRVVGSPTFASFHSVPLNADLLVSAWTQNERFSLFDSDWNALPVDRRAFFESALQEAEALDR
jgi:hypothetical protein